MQHSLLCRFQGALLGSLMGELVSYDRDPGFRNSVGRKSLQFVKSPPQRSQTNLGVPKVSAWSQIATCGLESVIETGGLNLDDWLTRCHQTHPSLLELKGNAQSGEIALSTLHLALFFHENQDRLRQSLVQAAAIWQVDPNVSAGVLATAIAIAVILTETFNPTTLIPQILNSLGTEPTPLTDQLHQVQTLIEAGSDLETTTTNLRRSPDNLGNREDASDMAIALAFYCFLYTPEDFGLCVSRAIRSGDQTPITAALTGALAGVYNGINGIPVNWRMAALTIPAFIQRWQLTDQLLAVWLGVYDQRQSTDRYKQAAIAAPDIIQRRL